MTKKVLIVDDKEDDLNSMKNVLEKEDYETVTAINGSYAIDELKKNKFDLILIDILMPTLI